MVTDARLTDERAVELARGGDDLGFSELYRRYAPPLRRMATSVLRDPHAAEDVVQATFVVAAQRLDQLSDAGRVRGWLTSICARQALTVLRARRPELALDPDADDVPSDRRDGPEDVAVANERLDILLEAAQGLPPSDRVVIRLYLQGFEGTALAEALESEPARSYVQFHRAKGRMHSSLGALLVARHARHACEELERLLDEWDGTFTPLLRKRIVRHVDACDECEARRRRLLTPQSLLGALVLLGVPAGLRPPAARADEQAQELVAYHQPLARRRSRSRHRHARSGRPPAGPLALTAGVMLAAVVAGTATTGLTSPTLQDLPVSRGPAAPAPAALAAPGPTSAGPGAGSPPATRTKSPAPAPAQEAPAGPAAPRRTTPPATEQPAITQPGTVAPPPPSPQRTPVPTPPPTVQPPPEPTPEPTPPPTGEPTPPPTVQPPAEPTPEPTPPSTVEPTPPPPPEPTPPATSTPTPQPPPSPLAPLVGTWSLQPITEGGVTYVNTAMVILADGTGQLVSHDEDSCHWKDGDPVWRNLQGSGTSFSGERYIGPCVPEPFDWLPATIVLGEDGRTLTETVNSTGVTRVWTKRD